VGFVQTPGAAPRALGQGALVAEGDTLTTGKDSFAILKLTDGTRMTVRPNTELVMNTYRYEPAAQTGSMVFGLLRGGLRTLTGLIAKSSPDAAKIRTATATIGIRGTDFDARICAKDCAEDSRTLASKAAERSSVVTASARVVQARGEVFATGGTGSKRRVVDGGALYSGDTVETAIGGGAVIAFRDNSRMGLGGQSRFKIESFVFDTKTPSEGRFLLNFLRGTARVVTGLIGKADTKNVRVSTSTATIGIRGTEFVMSCLGECAGEAPSAAAPGTGCEVFTVESEVILTPTAPSCTSKDLSIVAGSGIRLAANCTPEVINTLPPGAVPAIDIPIDMDRLFGLQTPQESETGLFLFVRDGHIEIDSGGTLLHLGRGETGQLELGGTSLRPAFIPRFIEFDVIPLATGTGSVMDLVRGVGVSAASVCKK
jgi:hypothetical protein